MFDPILAATVEIMVAGYYMMLIAGIDQKNIVFTGVIIAVCLLSRYYVVLWLPLWAFALFISGHKKQLFKTILVIFITLSVLYFIPFLNKDWSSLYNSFKTYETCPLGEWHRLNIYGKPLHLYAGTGFAYLFYEKYLHTDLIVGYKMLTYVFHIAIMGSLFLMGLWYWFNRKKIDNRIFLMASFKIYITVFLALIMIPYIYLVIIANFISIAIFAEQARYKLDSKDVEK